MPAVPDRPSARNSAEVPRLGRYRVCYRIAQGGMASVYLARLDTTVGFSKWVALKIIHPNIAADEKFVTMFLDEARLAAQLDHPNLCTVFDFGEEEGTYFIAMEYLHGETLGAVARKAWGSQGALPLEFGVRVVADASRGLHAAHELRDVDGSLANVVHRDVSPENLFVTYTGTAKIVDFGVARSNVQEHERTATGELKGKLAYMSPEQLHERGVDRRTDVWALGVVLWEITVGRRLFRRATDAQTVFAITRDPITRPARLREDYPEGLEAIVMRALDRDPERRYQSALELSRALENWLNHSAHPTGMGEVGEFMQALFADQMIWRDQYLRGGDGPFEDLIAQWQSAPRPSVEEIDPNTVAMTFGAPQRNSAPEEPSDPTMHRVAVPPRVAPVTREVPVNAPGAAYDQPDESEEEVIPLTRRTIPPGRRTPTPVNAMVARQSRPSSPPRRTPPQATAMVLRQSTPSPYTPPPLQLDVPAPIVVPLRRRRWADYVTIVALFALGGVMAHIWYDRPRPRASTSRAPPQTPARQTPPPRPVALQVTRDAGAAPGAPIDAVGSRDAGPRRRRGDVVDAVRHQEGYLTLTANLPTEVYVGARLLGTAPISHLAMEPGLYALRVVTPGRNEERQVMVTVREGATATTLVRWPAEGAPSP